MKCIVLISALLLIGTFSREAYSQTDPLFPIRDHGKWGFIDGTGKVRISPQFDDAFWINNVFDRDLEPAKKGKNWGFIKRDGTWAIEPTFGLVTKFHDSVAAVETDSGWTFITKSGGYLRVPDIQNVTDAGEDYYAVVLPGENEWTYMDRSASYTLPIHQNIPEAFSEGLLAVEENGKWGFVDENDDLVIQPRFDEANQFSESFAAVRIGSKWGYIDKTGKVVIRPQFGWAYGFCEGLAAVEVSPKKYGFIDKTGRLAIPAKFDEGGCFSESLAAVGINRRLGFIDKNGTVLIQGPFVQADSFSSGIARVMLEDSKLAYVDKSGHFIWREK